MPIIIIIGILTVYGVWGVYNALTRNTKVYTKEELQQMSREMTGRTQSQCRAVLKKHKK